MGSATDVFAQHHGYSSHQAPAYYDVHHGTYAEVHRGVVYQNHGTYVDAHPTTYVDYHHGTYVMPHYAPTHRYAPVRYSSRRHHGFGLSIRTSRFGFSLGGHH